MPLQVDPVVAHSLSSRPAYRPSAMAGPSQSHFSTTRVCSATRFDMDGIIPETRHKGGLQ